MWGGSTNADSSPYSDGGSHAETDCDFHAGTDAHSHGCGAASRNADSAAGNSYHHAVSPKSNACAKRTCLARAFAR